jgi:hypothetical protein
MRNQLLVIRVLGNRMIAIKIYCIKRYTTTIKNTLQLVIPLIDYLEMGKESVDVILHIPSPY